MSIIDGKLIANKILNNLKQEVSALSFQPVFCDVLVGDDPVSRSYVNIKGKRAQEIGLEFQLAELPAAATTEEVIEKIYAIQKNSRLAGLIVQLPLPVGLDKQRILSAIDSKLDVDGLMSTSFVPPTASAVLEILSQVQADLKNSKILIVGQGDLVGKPLKQLLTPLARQIDTIVEATSSDLQFLAPQADIIISAAGQPNLITADLVKSDAIVIDCGTSESAGSIVGDVNTESVALKASLLAPVPGGVGPVTIACLLSNVVQVAKSLTISR